MGSISTLGIIPARADSKGVPGKNIRSLGGKPLIAYTIEAALKSDIDRVIVSTEDERIAKVAIEHGAEVPFLRPKELAADDTPSISVLIHALKQLAEKEGYRPDVVAFLQPTSPFRTQEHINAGLELLSKSEVDSVVGVCEVDANSHPYFVYAMAQDNTLRELIEMDRKPLRR
ncbi:MAG: acylneuraminate cytidylyltransferase family protein, partial [Candidatus Hadarchaeales archaeon]